jgi:hypothetical protein
MDRNWNRNGGGGGAIGGEKMYRHNYTSGCGGASCGGSGGHYNHQSNHYRKKNDYNSQDFYSKNMKPVVQPLKKDSLQVSLVEDELNSANFSWIKNISLN